MDILVRTLSLLPLEDIIPIIEQDKELNIRFRQYVSSGHYFADIAGGLDPTLLPDLEKALLDFDSNRGYPKVYHLISKLHKHGFIATLPVQVEQMNYFRKRIVDMLRFGEKIPEEHPAFHDPKFQCIYTVYENLPDEIKADREKALSLVRKNRFIYECVLPKFQDDKEIALTVVSENGSAYKLISSYFHDDREIVLATVTQSPSTLLYVSEKFRDDKEIILAAVSQYSWVSMFTSDRLKRDRDVIMAGSD